MRLACVVLVTAALVSACGVPGRNGVESSSASAERIPDDGPVFDTPEEAALVSAAVDTDSAGSEWDAKVIFRHPQVPTDVRVRTSSVDYCAVWAPVFHDERQGWIAFGQPSEC